MNKEETSPSFRTVRYSKLQIICRNVTHKYHIFADVSIVN